MQFISQRLNVTNKMFLQNNCCLYSIHAILLNNYLYLTMIELQPTIHTNLKYKTKKGNTEVTHLKHYI